MDLLSNFHIGKFRLPKWVCALLTIFSFFLVIFGVGALFLPLVIHEIQTLMDIDFATVAAILEKPLNFIDDQLALLQLGNGEGTAKAALKESINSFFDGPGFTDLFNTLIGTLGNIITIVAAVFSISFIGFFFLTDPKLFYNFGAYFVPGKYKEVYREVVDTSKKLLSRYFIGVLIQVTLIATLVTIGLLIFGVENALLIGVFAGIINIIPYIGPIIGLIVGLFIGLTSTIEYAALTSQMLPISLEIITIFITVQILDNIFFQPIIFSSSIRAHPLEIFLLIWVAGTIAGIQGMILAIPSYTVVRVVVKEVLIHLGYLPPGDEEDDGSDSMNEDIKGVLPEEESQNSPKEALWNV